MKQIDFKSLAEQNDKYYFNALINHVNDHVVKMSVMTTAYPWHLHPNSDETFIGIEGTVIIETEKETFELTSGNSITIPRNVLHRTKPKGDRSVNLTIELADMKTIFRE